MKKLKVVVGLNDFFSIKIAPGTVWLGVIRNKQEKNKRKKILVLGETSSLAEKIIPILTKKDFEIIGTRRNINKKNLKIDSLISLDLSDIKSVKKTLKNIENKEFTHVLCLIGAYSYIPSNPVKSLRQINIYINTYVTNLIYFLDNLFYKKRIKANGRLLVFSSRAAKFGSNDRYYAVAKSALEGFVKSRGNFLPGNIRINIVSAGLIKYSKMYSMMPKKVVLSHEKRSKNSLLDVQAIAIEIADILEDNSKLSGQIIYLGPQYE